MEQIAFAWTYLVLIGFGFAAVWQRRVARFAQPSVLT
jgi:hypothetical protein